MKELSAISLFSGAGGLDYGFEAAGFVTLAAVESDEDCCATLRKNRQWQVIERLIEKVTSDEMLKASGLKRGEVDVLIGGPPCQPFSKSGYWATGDTKRLNDPRAGTLAEYMRCVEDIQPKVFLLENVHGINYSGKEQGFQLIERLTKEINKKTKANYKLSWDVLNAADYGVPQMRRRFFLVGDRAGRRFNFPAPTHWQLDGDTVQGVLRSDGLLPYVTAWDAIGSLVPDGNEDLKVKGRWADLLPSIPEGENYLWHTNRKGGLPLFGWRTRYWSFLLKLAKAQPSWTIQAQPGPAIGPFHWENRLLSVHEMAQLQTFPPGVQFVGGRNSVQKQIGNAVPSLLGEVLACEIRRQLFSEDVPRELTLAVKLQRPLPPPERVTPVPKKYLSLVGDYPDHPGTGKGPAKVKSENGPHVI